MDYIFKVLIETYIVILLVFYLNLYETIKNAPISWLVGNMCGLISVILPVICLYVILRKKHDS